jgi:hypothetical protein
MDLAAEELDLEAGGKLEGGRPEGARGREAGRSSRAEGGRSSRAGGQKELEGGRLARRKIGGGGRKLKGERPEGARGREAGKARSTAGDLWELDREASGTSASLSPMRTGGRR